MKDVGVTEIPVAEIDGVFQRKSRRLKGLMCTATPPMNVKPLDSSLFLENNDNSRIPRNVENAFSSSLIRDTVLVDITNQTVKMATSSSNSKIPGNFNHSQEFGNICKRTKIGGGIPFFVVLL